MNPYIADILSQPDVLRNVVNQYSPKLLKALHQRLAGGEFDRILMTGMGASYNAAYPAYLQLVNLPVPVLQVNAAELVHYAGGLVGTHTLLWINSQSGRSAELLHLLERLESAPPACLLTFVNDQASPLASAAEVCLPIYAGPEHTVSTKTYVNTLAVNSLAAQQLAGRDIEPLRSAMLTAADEMEHFLSDWQARVNKLDEFLGDFEDLILLGRGASMAAVWNGALINKEAAKFSLEGMHAAEFRHGPLELASPGFTALIFAGASKTMQYNHNLALEILKHNGRVLWVDTKKDAQLPTILIPDTEELVRPLVEILPMQLLTLALADRNDMIAGQFKLIGKVTTVE